MKKAQDITILYITYVDLSPSAASGSGVRPYRVLRQMQALGYRVVVLEGEQMGEHRKEAIKKIRAFLKKEKPDLCYIESPTYPIMRHADRKLIKTIHKMGIPIGYFYRDFYRMFPKEFPRRTSLMGRAKEFVLDALQFLTDRALKHCNVVYLPSAQAEKLFSFSCMKPLPPAGEDCLAESPQREPNTAIYVGAVGGCYDGGLLLDAFERVYQQNPLCKLLLVCRKPEWEQLEHPLKHAPWLEVHHTSGAGLAELYRRASIALAVPHAGYEYTQFSVSVKVFEYISYGLPVVATNTAALSQVVLGEGIGIVTDSTAEAFAQGVQSLLGDSEKREALERDVQRALLERNLWQHRIEQIVSDLLPQERDG